MNVRALALVLLLAAPGLLPAAGGTTPEIELSAWQRIPVLEGGRVMPLDSCARHLLLGFSGRSTFDRRPAAWWLARTLCTPDAARGDAIFLVNHPEVVEALGLAAAGRGRYSFAQLEPALPALTRLARAAFHLEEATRSAVDTEFMRLFQSLSRYRALAEGFDFALPRPEFDLREPDLRRDLGLPADGPVAFLDLRERVDRVTALLEKYRAAPPESHAGPPQELARAAMAMRTLSQSRRERPPAILPRADASGLSWMGAWDALAAGGDGGAGLDEVAALRDMVRTFRAGESAEFDRAARAFLDSTGRRVRDPEQARQLDLEVRYNRSDAFYRAEMLYGFAFLVALLSVTFRRRWLGRAALLLVVAALIPHTYGIVARMTIMGRPPVTNLYSTFVFVGWVCVVFALAVEYFQRNRLGLITAGSMGLALLMTSARFGADGDTMGVMVAVLDSNFWLATHVVCISVGYAGCCAAGLLGHIYLLQALRRPPGDAVLAETDRAVYGAQAFGLIFSFLGTMLGGIWADQSWGRFWGWDPKENGALVIVLWSAVLFHARIGRMIGPAGFAAGSVLGILGVLAAWIGVNLLGVGLHAYGFTSGLAGALALIAGIEIVFVAVTVALARRRAQRTGTPS